jgi:hypothetical protein
VSRDFHLITRRRPTPWAFARTLSEAAGRQVDITGDFADPDDYLNVAAVGIWAEVEPPGHVEYADLRKLYPDDVVLPEPDDEGCLWYSTASIPAGAPSLSADVIETTFQRLADDYEGIALEPQ